ncbi:hypothetical protein PoB_005922400 [Plakobranchus ocellatus]|uniref:Uncharacterized protein n=1 Tax=Plakobranchus ocellatus TaxID=259542 RepID=A0AAV4CIU7_9GAST|nr:hypothetical protein PoB_005922400 [Plakobranchus ocellatus]
MGDLEHTTGDDLKTSFSTRMRQILPTSQGGFASHPATNATIKGLMHVNYKILKMGSILARGLHWTKPISSFRNFMFIFQHACSTRAVKSEAYSETQPSSQTRGATVRTEPSQLASTSTTALSSLTGK